MNTEIIYSTIIILFSVIILSIYYKIANFKKPLGILMFVLGITALGIRLYAINFPIRWINLDNILPSLLLLLIPSLIFIFYTIRKGKALRKYKSYFLKLFPAYLFFGALQQLFFLAVFTDSVYILSQNKILALIIGSIFYFLFHFLLKKYHLQKFILIVAIFGILNIFVYLYFETLIPQMILHGILGSFLFCGFSDSNQIKRRLG